MPRHRRPLALAVASFAFAGGAMAVAGCPGTTTPAIYVPQTGITIHVLDLLHGLQCGTGPGQVYKYTAVVSYAPGDAGAGNQAADAGAARDAAEAGRASDGGDAGAAALPVSNVWDCFTDGIFENLPADSLGNASFTLQVFAYSYAGAVAAEARLDGAAGDGGGAGASLVVDPDSAPGALWCPGGVGANGSLCRLQDAATAETVGAWAQWTTTCDAMEMEGAPVTAACGALQAVAPAGSATTDAQSDVAAEAMTDAPGEASPEGSADSSVDAAIEASPDGASDGPLEASADGSSDASLDAPLDGD